jgi:hypothetical protein
LENGLLVADFVEDSSASNTTWEGFVILTTKARMSRGDGYGFYFIIL